MVDSSADTHTDSLAHTNIIICLRASYALVLSSPRFFCVAFPPFHEAGVGKLVTQLEAVHVLPPPFFWAAAETPPNCSSGTPPGFSSPNLCTYESIPMYLSNNVSICQSMNLCVQDGDRVNVSHVNNRAVPLGAYSVIPSSTLWSNSALEGNQLTVILLFLR